MNIPNVNVIHKEEKQKQKKEEEKRKLKKGEKWGGKKEGVKIKKSKNAKRFLYNP